MMQRWRGLVAGLSANAIALYGAAQPQDVPVAVVATVVIVYGGLVVREAYAPWVSTRALSPALLIALLTLVFYVVCPWIFLLTGPLNQAPRVWYDQWISYNGSHAEYLLLQFSALFLFVSTLGRAPRSGRNAFAIPEDAAVRRTAIRVSLALAVAATLFKTVDAYGVLPSGIPFTGLIWTAAAPLTFFGLSVAVLYASVDTDRVFLSVVAAASACIAPNLLIDIARLPISLILFLVLGVLVVRKFPHRRLIMGGLTFVIVIVALTAASATYRNLQHHNSEPLSKIFVSKIASKVLLRQTISAWCLEQARQEHWNAEPVGSYINLLAGLVPRAIWPDKPDLSRGSYYAVRYCKERVEPNNPHSEALTLLAEPIIERGREGHFAGEALIVAFIAIATIGMFRTGSVGIATGTAMLPWLTGVEQHLSYYLATCVKMFLFMLPFALILHWYVRRAERKARL